MKIINNTLFCNSRPSKLAMLSLFSNEFEFYNNTICGTVVGVGDLCSGNFGYCLSPNGRFL